MTEFTNKIVTCSSVISLWDYNANEIKHVQDLNCHEGQVTSVKFNYNSMDGSLVSRIDRIQ